MTEVFAEVIATSTSEITGQCRTGSQPPGFGAFLSAGQSPVCIAVLYSLESVSMDPSRRPSAMGYSPEQLASRHPQLAMLMRQNLHALLIGSWDGASFRYGLPERPPGIHDEIRLCEPEYVHHLSENLGFLQLLHRSLPVFQEEIILATSRTLLSVAGNQDADTFQQRAVHIGKTISSIYRDDYDSLRRIMNRLETMMGQQS